jgi:hypothetical protein
MIVVENTRCSAKCSDAGDVEEPCGFFSSFGSDDPQEIEEL